MGDMADWVNQTFDPYMDGGGFADDTKSCKYCKETCYWERVKGGKWRLFEWYTTKEGKLGTRTHKCKEYLKKKET